MNCRIVCFYHYFDAHTPLFSQWEVLQADFGVLSVYSDCTLRVLTFCTKTLVLSWPSPRISLFSKALVSFSFRIKNLSLVVLIVMTVPLLLSSLGRQRQENTHKYTPMHTSTGPMHTSLGLYLYHLYKYIIKLWVYNYTFSIHRRTEPFLLLCTNVLKILTFDYPQDIIYLLSVISL